ncbi:hypothetical protein MLD38_009537 [Melastoma candidum]|uniref:Uncharacterized protein n=1 Tax=Melastoma candidum TaxID=119954 RepID=A0ACB9S271_9MYRT|nr:hypothetical protein MLD38_009537 [Melastoma candidum]
MYPRQKENRPPRANGCRRRYRHRRPSQAVKPIVIREVWAHNLMSEFEIISRVVSHYSHVSMDTEFPGVVFQDPNPIRHFSAVDHYKVLKMNVDVLNIIQLGLTFSDSDGNLPDLGTDCRYIWEFNFRDFDPERNIHNRDSIDLLRKQGIDFDRNRTEGIDSTVFAGLMVQSGLVCNNSVSWVTFQSGYDFGYLVKILTRAYLPAGLDEFLQVLRFLFGERVYDIKHMIRFCNSLYGGLDRVAKALEVDRAVGKCHQAGSDSLLTWQAFKKMRELYFEEEALAKHAGVVYGLEVN